MIKLDNYVKAESIDEAYHILQDNKDNYLLGGGIYLNLLPKKVNTLINIDDLGLSYIEDKEDTIEIGALTTFRELETSKVLEKYYGDIFYQALKGVVGIQLRNAVTVGGSVYSKYGFSDLITLLLALDCKVVLHEAGEIPLDQFLLKHDNLKTKDILEKIIIVKEDIKLAFKYMRNNTAAYSILNVAVAKGDFGFRVSVGSRPAVARRMARVEKFLNEQESIDEEIAYEAGELSKRGARFGSNNLASSDYRKEVSKILVKRAIMEVI